MLPEGDADGRLAPRQRLRSVGASGSDGFDCAAELSQVPLAAGGTRRAEGSCFPKAGSIRTCSRSICASAIPGACCWPKCPSVELLEVQLVNAIAPFILNARLKPLMLRTPERDKHIVNVSAVEGQFYRKFKTTRHPHTNMAKAALNMMTRTSAADYHADGIHMNAWTPAG